ncbi:activating signal cointegrator 1 complex subunit 2 [Anopheles maculipalpis]|uniref:activating signal cointegrator 1 complex subunit 2 n=1 Tax=Anopheles maculipalpis TaxID=1496333 RepID=UPI002159A121|nr:activating signal cointegrator 1 complex subunit 2 [Anopheles maculipalpis]
MGVFGCVVFQNTGTPSSANDAGNPLNTRKITHSENGVQRSIAALHTTWKDGRCFTKYTAFLVNGEQPVSNAMLDQWANETEWFIKDMKHLLNLEHHRFWSTIVYNTTTLESILSFMQNALPFYLVPVMRAMENDHILPLYTAAHAYVFKVIVRLTTLRESETCWMEPEFYGKLVYKNFIITVPLLFDLISIYSRDNMEHVSRIIETILKLQPKYIQDLRQGLSYLLSAFTIIQTRCESELSEANASESTLNDLTLYAQDCSSVLVQLVAISATLRQICSELNVEFAISNFYDNVLIVLYRNIQEVNKHSQYLTYLNDMRVELLETFRSILSVQLEKIMESADDSLLAADKFISILTECLANNVFVNDYKTLFDIEDDLAIVQLGYKSVDQVKYDFIQKAYAKDSEPQAESSRTNSSANAEQEIDQEMSVVTAEQSEMEQKIEQNVQYIKELLPHLEAAQIRKVLCTHDNVEEAVSVLLEQDSSSSAHQSGTDVPHIPPDPLDEFYLRTGIDRLNIYDGDEFDVMVNDKVKGIIKKGKGMPGQPKTLTALLDDKSHIQQARHIYRQFDLVAENDLDDDEYDDSFEAMTESESRHVKLSKDARNAIADQELANESDSENNESEEEQEANQNQSLAFCENPELARKRYEEKLNSKYLRRHGGPAASGPREADVRGNPKGQGQDSKVLLNRRHKNENKALSGNHNRKQGASYKRNRGMMPS